VVLIRTLEFTKPQVAQIYLGSLRHTDPCCQSRTLKLGRF